MLGVAASTVAGRLRISGLSAVGLQNVHHRLAALQAEIQFGGGEGFR
jgi:hypothetical protein